jgi:hypothetical protein
MVRAEETGWRCVSYVLGSDSEERSVMLRKLLASAAVVAVVLLGSVSVASADNPGTQGPPSQSCGSATAQNTPGGGNSANSPGSPFTGGTADGKYNVAKSQYDVACFQVSQPHP